MLLINCEYLNAEFVQILNELLDTSLKVLFATKDICGGNISL